MVFKLHVTKSRTTNTFENDVKMYGIQTRFEVDEAVEEFENDVKMYGIQTGRD